MSPMHPDDYRVLLDDRRRAIVATRTASARWRARTATALVRTGDGLRTLGRRLEAGPASPPAMTPDCC